MYQKLWQQLMLLVYASKAVTNGLLSQQGLNLQAPILSKTWKCWILNFNQIWQMESLNITWDHIRCIPKTRCTYLYAITPNSKDEAETSK